MKLTNLWSWPLAFFAIFLVLKLIDKIDWSWWWITAPLWVCLIIGALITIQEARKESRMSPLQKLLLQRKRNREKHL